MIAQSKSAQAHVELGESMGGGGLNNMFMMAEKLTGLSNSPIYK